MNITKYPDQYLHVTESLTGETWIVPIGANTPLDLERLVKKWAKSMDLLEDCDGNRYRVIISEHSGGLLAYHAAIYTDGRPPDGGVCWASRDFYIDERP